MIDFICRDRQFANAFDENFLSNPQNCPYQGRSLRELAEGPEEQLDVPTFFKHAAVWLVVSSFGSLVLGMIFLEMFKHAPRVMVRHLITYTAFATSHNHSILPGIAP